MRLHSGDVCPKTGTYRVINEDGKTLNSVFVGEGEPMPPTQCSSAATSLPSKLGKNRK